MFLYILATTMHAPLSTCLITKEESCRNSFRGGGGGWGVDDCPSEEVGHLSVIVGGHRSFTAGGCFVVLAVSWGGESWGFLGVDEPLCLGFRFLVGRVFQLLSRKLSIFGVLDGSCCGGYRLFQRIHVPPRLGSVSSGSRGVSSPSPSESNSTPPPGLSMTSGRLAAVVAAAVPWVWFLWIVDGRGIHYDGLLLCGGVTLAGRPVRAR